MDKGLISGVCLILPGTLALIMTAAECLVDTEGDMLSYSLNSIDADLYIPILYQNA